PLQILFEDEGPWYAMANSQGEFNRTLQTARRTRGIYRVRVRGVRTDLAAEFRVVPASEPVRDPRFEARYAYFLREATRMLRDAEFGVPLSNDFEGDRFDREFWQWESERKYSRVLQLRPGKTPAQAIDALFDRLTAWKVDCAYTVQIANLYAMRMTYGAALFNHREGPQMRLRMRESTGLTTRLHYGRERPSDPWRIVHDFEPPNKFVFAAGPPLQMGTDQLVAGAPARSRVRGPNLAAQEGDSFRHENTVKLGAESYGTGGAVGGLDDPLTGNVFTRDSLEI